MFSTLSVSSDNICLHNPVFRVNNNALSSSDFISLFSGLNTLGESEGLKLMP